MEKGIDLSCWNTVHDFNAIKSAGFKFVILRAGFGRLSGQKDSNFEDFYKRARAAGLKIGAYWYSYATSPQEAEEEAKACLECIKGKKFEMPIFYDLEEDDTYKTGKVNDIILKFAEYLKSKKYIPGVYSSPYYLETYIDPKIIKSHQYPLWVAQWFTVCQYTQAPYQIWQYTENEYVPGVEGHCDANQCYSTFDYIKRYGWNGYASTPQSTNTDPKDISADELKAVIDTCAGKYGTGSARSQAYKNKNLNPTRMQNFVNMACEASSIYDFITQLKKSKYYT